MKNEVIVISAIWCPSCLIMKKYLKRLQEEHGIKIVKLDYDLDEDEVKKYNVGDKLPVIICQNKRIVGEKNYEELSMFLKECGLI